MSEKLRFVLWIHIILIIAIWSSPFYLTWKIILGLIFLYYIQLAIFGNCILTSLQFHENKRSHTTYSFVLEKLGFIVDRKRLVFFVDFIIPWMIFGFALFWQIILGK